MAKTNNTQVTKIQTPTGQQWMSPIIIKQKVANYRILINQIRKKTVGHNNFITKFSKYQTKILTTNCRDHDHKTWTKHVQYRFSYIS